MRQQVRDVYCDKEEFEELLDIARMNTETDWEENFIAEITENFRQHGGGMYLSDSQNDHINRIASAGE